MLLIDPSLLRFSETRSSSSLDHRPSRRPQRPPIGPPDDKSISSIAPPQFPHPPPPSSMTSPSSGVWSWLSRRSATTPSQLANPPSSPAENHYTHMEEAYSGVEEALYAELDRESNSPAYQNSAYTDPDAPTSSAPSSAYYSDLSVTTVPERAYEVVGLSTLPVWDSSGIELKRQTARLAAISEAISVPSDYV